MRKKINVVIYVGDEVMHVNQVFVAFGMFYRMGLINIQFKLSDCRISLKPFLECIIDERKVIFDMHDSADYIDKHSYDWCDYYFKRSVNATQLNKYVKIIPWGLNFYITSRTDFSYQRALRNPYYKKKISLLLRSSRIASAILNINNGSNTVDENFFFRYPGKHPKKEVLFSPRLWDPARVTGRRNEERIIMNAERIRFVRALRKNFPNYYSGGIEDTTYARKLCPDLIISRTETHKSAYVARLREASIGLASPGLADSIGWKLSEYVAFSKAIVSNDLDHHVLNTSFLKGQNYLAYNNDDEMLEAVDKLLSDDSFCFEMMKNNYAFSQHWLLPEKQLRQAFERMSINLNIE